MGHSISTGQLGSWYSKPLFKVTIVALIFMLSGFFTPAMAGPALYFTTLVPPKLPKMSYSQCVAKAYRAISLRVGEKSKAKKSYALGWTSDITAVVTCSKVGNTTTATVMVTSPSNAKAKDLLPQLVGDMRTPNF